MTDKKTDTKKLIELEILKCNHCQAWNIGLNGVRIAGCGHGSYSIYETFHVEKKDIEEAIKGIAEHQAQLDTTTGVDEELVDILRFIDKQIEIITHSNFAETGKRYEVLYFKKIRKLLEGRHD